VEEATPGSMLLEELTKQFETNGIVNAGENANKLNAMVVRILADNEKNLNALSGYGLKTISRIAAMCTMDKDVVEFACSLKKNDEHVQGNGARGIDIHRIVDGALFEVGRRLSQQVEVKSIPGPKAALPAKMPTRR
jgi:hypothetical protein